jgi:hypothetical protein
MDQGGRESSVCCFVWQKSSAPGACVSLHAGFTPLSIWCRLGGRYHEPNFETIVYSGLFRLLDKTTPCFTHAHQQFEPIRKIVFTADNKPQIHPGIVSRLLTSHSTPTAARLIRILVLITLGLITLGIRVACIRMPCHGTQSAPSQLLSRVFLQRPHRLPPAILFKPNQPPTADEKIHPPEPALLFTVEDADGDFLSFLPCMSAHRPSWIFRVRHLLLPP